MSDEQINAAIAEVCGWRNLIFTSLGQSLQRWIGRKKKHETLQATPDYCNDLNAMHEAEKALSEERNHYIDILGTMYSDSWEFATATARQRAEAFLRTLGKWEEDK
jgi:hypothetical protein